ncbi:MAG: cob(I)yrinic acid a,c-diamide adenosyltransferase [Candidatus Kerfeldbacteria bacterium]|nr:cob(I)yrinic acid a,c-diamide adenosyltransferase [Candidatus Kerfeldbacteria bacterium]
MIIHPKPANDRSDKSNLGYLHIYTGAGKGKTSAALGAMVRAAGQGQRVVMIQFLKGHKDAGEVQTAQTMKNVELLQFGRPELTSLDQLQAMDEYLANQGLNYAREVMRRRRPDLLILDEITTAVQYRLLLIEDVVDFLDNRHRATEVILTGREAHPALLNMADLVTVMQPTKHYFQYQGFQPRWGIER